MSCSARTSSGAGTPDEGLLSSHRILSTATHAGDGAYGKASGRTVRYRIVADCHARDNRIDDEWIIRDQGAIVRQLGWEPAGYARHLITSEGGPDACVRPFSPEADRPGPYAGRGNDNEWGERYADVLTPHHGGRHGGRRGRVRPRLPARVRAGDERKLPRLRDPVLDGASRELSLRGVRHRPSDRPGGSAHAAPRGAAVELAGPSPTVGEGSALRPKRTCT